MLSVFYTHTQKHRLRMEIHTMNVNRTQRKDNGLEIMYIETGTGAAVEYTQERVTGTGSLSSHPLCAHLRVCSGLLGGGMYSG